MWAACCLGYFGFMGSGELTSLPGTPPAILASDVAVDSHAGPSMLKVLLRRANTDPFGHGVHFYLGRTGSLLCPVSAVLNYLAGRPPGKGALFILEDGALLSREQCPSAHSCLP